MVLLKFSPLDTVVLEGPEDSRRVYSYPRVTNSILGLVRLDDLTQSMMEFCTVAISSLRPP